MIAFVGVSSVRRTGALQPDDPVIDVLFNALIVEAEPDLRSRKLKLYYGKRHIVAIKVDGVVILESGYTAGIKGGLIVGYGTMRTTRRSSSRYFVSISEPIYVYGDPAWLTMYDREKDVGTPTYEVLPEKYGNDWLIMKKDFDTQLFFGINLA